MKKGKFIVIEGLDGSGASTQINLVHAYLQSRGLKGVYTTKEPTDNVIGGLIRGSLTGVYELPPASLQLLFAADRGHHLKRVIEPQLGKGATVICDRYMWSTVAFGSLHLDKKWLLGLQRYFMVPDLTIILKVDPKECVKRIAQNRFDFELFEEEEKLRKVWKTYAWLAKRPKFKIKIVNGGGSKEEVFANVKKCIDKLFRI